MKRKIVREIQLMRIAKFLLGRLSELKNGLGNGVVN